MNKINRNDVLFAMQIGTVCLSMLYSAWNISMYLESTKRFISDPKRAKLALAGIVTGAILVGIAVVFIFRIINEQQENDQE